MPIARDNADDAMCAVPAVPIASGSGVERLISQNHAKATTEPTAWRSYSPSNYPFIPSTPPRSTEATGTITVDRAALSTKDCTLETLLASGKRFRPVERVSALLDDDALRDAIRRHETDGLPMIIERWHERPAWRKDLFTIDWLLEHGDASALLYARL